MKYLIFHTHSVSHCILFQSALRSVSQSVPLVKIRLPRLYFSYSAPLSQHPPRLPSALFPVRIVFYGQSGLLFFPEQFSVRKKVQQPDICRYFYSTLAINWNLWSAPLWIDLRSPQENQEPLLFTQTFIKHGRVHRLYDHGCFLQTNISFPPLTTILGRPKQLPHSCTGYRILFNRRHPRILCIILS